MKITLQSWLWLLASISCYTTGEYFSKKIAEKFSIWYLFIIMACYAGSGLFWIPAMMQRNSLIVLGFIWTILSVFSTLIIGYSMGETLATIQFVGVVFSIVGLLLLSI